MYQVICPNSVFVVGEVMEHCTEISPLVVVQNFDALCDIVHAEYFDARLFVVCLTEIRIYIFLSI